jgi:hypothetical protein
MKAGQRVEEARKQEGRSRVGESSTNKNNNNKKPKTNLDNKSMLRFYRRIALSMDDPTAFKR